MWSLLTFSAFIFLAALGAAVPIPDNDPFYKPPSGFEAKSPGYVFKSRSTPTGISGVTGTQILYRTTDANGGAIATVATILKNPQSSSSVLVSYQDFEDAANRSCSASYDFYSQSGGLDIFGPTISGELNEALAKGWTIVVPDYEGPYSSFSVGHLEGHAVLDGLRATLNFKPAGVKSTAVLGGLGYSGGAIATGWAASLHHTYAPELNIKGWAFGGTPANLTSTLVNVDGTIFAGFGAAGIAGQISAYPEALARFKEIATAAGFKAIAQVQSQCAISDILGFLGQKFLSTTFQSLGAGLLQDSVIKGVLAKNIMGVNKAETPIAPVYMYHGSADEVIPYAAAQAAAARWCSFGASVNFATNGGTGHVGTALAVSGTAVDWLALRMAGNPPPPGCTTTTLSLLGLPLK